MSDLRRTLAVGASVILALVAGVLWLLAGFVVRPVSRMADTARRIAPDRSLLGSDLAAVGMEGAWARATAVLSFA